jgi:hypothetical protein
LAVESLKVPALFTVTTPRIVPVELLTGSARFRIPPLTVVPPE